MMLALNPDAGYGFVARYLRRSGSPKRAQVVLDLGWDYKKRKVRRWNLNDEKLKYYGNHYKSSNSLKG